MKSILTTLAFSIYLAGISFAQEEIVINENLKLVKLTDNCFIHVSYKVLENYGNVAANGLICFENGKGVMIDTPWDDKQTAQLIEFLNDELKIMITDAIVCHWHEDCQGGLTELNKQGVNSYSCSLTKEIAQIKNLPLAKNTFSGSTTIEFGKTKIIGKYLGGGHTKDNIFVWIPEEGILFGGCSVKTAGANNLGNIEDADLEEWPKTIKKARKEFINAKIVVPGHGQHGGVDLLDHTLELLTAE